MDLAYSNGSGAIIRSGPLNNNARDVLMLLEAGCRPAYVADKYGVTTAAVYAFRKRQDGVRATETATTAPVTSGGFTIEASVPVPDAFKLPGRATIYPFRQMKVGDSFAFSGDRKVRSSVSVCARSVLGKGNYTVRKVDGGYRVWRLK